METRDRRRGRYCAVQMHVRGQGQRAFIFAIAAWLLPLAAGSAVAGEPTVAPEGFSSYRHEGFPAFSITFPAATRERPPGAPGQLFAGSTPEGVDFDVSVTDFPFAGILMPIEKAAEYFVGLAAASGTGSGFEVTHRSEVRWRDVERDVTVATQFVSAYRGGRLVMVAAHAADATEEASGIVESLRFE